jgi:hypothetical protein
MFDVPGYRVVRVLGAVYGLTVRTRNWAASLGMVLKSVAGGELRWFTNMVCPLSTSHSFCSGVTDGSFWWLWLWWSYELGWVRIGKKGQRLPDCSWDDHG